MRTDCEVTNREDVLHCLCKQCKRLLTDDEVALHKKIFNRGAKEFFCIDCSSEYLGVQKQLLEEKIVLFKKSGCTLFKENQNNTFA